MFTGIDHVTICVPDLARAMEQYRRLGFQVQTGGVHPGRGTHNAVALNEADYIELLAIHDVAEYRAARRGPASPHAGLDRFIEQGGGIRCIAIRSDDLAADVAAMRTRGVEVVGPLEASRRTPSGLELRWKAAVLGPKNPLPVFFVQPLVPLAERRKEASDGAHPNGVYTLERAYLVVPDVHAEAQVYAKVLGMPQPLLQRGTVIMADMAVFQIGPTGLSLAQPYAPGPAAEAIERRGPGPFQALYRTRSLDAAVRWMESQGLAPPARGVRNTGEQAMLVPPRDACGAYIGFVGPQ
jgi:catechol 2,3-dioxygenase-like lactoylglutathione lyase family enzyme